MGIFFKSAEEKQRRIELEEKEREQIRNSEMIKSLLTTMEQFLSEGGQLLDILRELHGGYVSVQANRHYMWASIKDSNFNFVRDVKLFTYVKNGMKDLSDNMTKEFNKLIKERMDKIPTLQKHGSMYTPVRKDW